MRPNRSPGRAVALVLLAVVVGACGTRLSDEEFAAARSQRSGVAEVGSASAAQTGDAPTAGDAAPVETPVAGEAPTPSQTQTQRTAASAPGATATPAPQAGAGPNQASDVGVTPTVIKIGTIVAENGVLGDTFAPAATGLRSWVAATNAAGGIAGRKVELVTCDDREDRSRTLECARKLVEGDQVFALIATNTRSMGGASTYLNDKAVPVLGNPINNAFYRFPHFFSVYGSPYPRDGKTVGFGGKIASYTTVYRFFRERFPDAPAAVFSYDVAESAQAGDAFEKGLQAEGFEVTRYVVSFAAPSFDAAVADMQRRGTKVVMDAMDEGANRRLCDAMERRNFAVGAKISTIPLMGESLAANFGDACRPVTYIPGDSLPYTETGNAFVARYRDGMVKYQRGKELHQWGLEAWVMGQMLQDYLQAAGPAPTRAGFEKHLLGLRGASPAGIMTPTIQYAVGNGSAPTVRDCVGISRWDDGARRWVLAAPFPYCIDDAKQYLTEVAEQGA